MPVLTLEEIKTAVILRQIEAISVDTSIFHQYNYGLEAGLLMQLEQFSRKGIPHLICDMILFEITSHLVTAAEKRQAELRTALKNLSNSWGMSKDRRDAVGESLFDKTAVQVTKERLDAFLESTHATTIECAEYAKLSDVTKLYYETKPPFGAKEDKKKEFPDAIALLALEEWSRINKKNILVVSSDGDWKGFCETSSFLYFIEKLPHALSSFQFGADDALAIFKKAIENGDVSDLIGQIDYKVNMDSDNIEIDVEVDSYFSCEHSVDQVIVYLHDAIEEILNNFEVINYEDESLELRLPINASIHVDVGIHLHAWDGGDREYVSIGSTTCSSIEDETLELVFRVSLDGGVEIESIELQPHRIYLRFEDVQPDYSDVQDEYD